MRPGAVQPQCQRGREHPWWAARPHLTEMVHLQQRFVQMLPGAGGKIMKKEKKGFRIHVQLRRNPSPPPGPIVKRKLMCSRAWLPLLTAQIRCGQMVLHLTQQYFMALGGWQVCCSA